MVQWYKLCGTRLISILCIHVYCVYMQETDRVHVEEDHYGQMSFRDRYFLASDKDEHGWVTVTVSVFSRVRDRHSWCRPLRCTLSDTLSRRHWRCESVCVLCHLTKCCRDCNCSVSLQQTSSSLMLLTSSSLVLLTKDTADGRHTHGIKTGSRKLLRVGYTIVWSGIHEYITRDYVITYLFHDRRARPTWA